MSEEVICYVGLGSNLQQPCEQVLTAIETLSNAENIRLLKTSSLHKTKPVGFLEQPDFVNAVIKLSVRMSAHQLLCILQAIENQQGRVRTKQRNGPRTIDLDLLLFGDQQINTADLVVPHPRMQERSFVLEPLAEVNRDLD